MSVKRTLREIDSAEFAEWMAYSIVEPFGPQREDQRAGVVASIVANVNRDTKSHPEPFTVEEFFPRYGEEAYQEPVSEDRLKGKLTAWAATMQAAYAKENGASRKQPVGRDKVEAPEARGHGKPGVVARGGRGRAARSGAPRLTQDAQ